MQKRLKNFAIKNPIKEVRSESDSSKTYLLYRSGNKVRCTCIGNAVRGTCKHVKAYEEAQK
jgi:hypothetical protein